MSAIGAGAPAAAPVLLPADVRDPNSRSDLLISYGALLLGTLISAAALAAF